MPGPKKFRQKRTDITAMQMPFTSDNPGENHAVYLWVESFLGSVPAPGYETRDSHYDGVTIDPADGLMIIRTPGHDYRVALGDWVIRNPSGEFSSLTPEQFAHNYESIPSSNTVIFQNNGLGNVGTHVQADTINHLEL